MCSVLSQVPASSTWGCPHEEGTHIFAYGTLEACLGARPLSQQPGVEGEDSGNFLNPRTLSLPNLKHWTLGSKTRWLPPDLGSPRVSQVWLLGPVRSWEVRAFTKISVEPCSPGTQRMLFEWSDWWDVSQSRQRAAGRDWVFQGEGRRASNDGSDCQSFRRNGSVEQSACIILGLNRNRLTYSTNARELGPFLTHKHISPELIRLWI